MPAGGAGQHAGGGPHDHAGAAWTASGRAAAVWWRRRPTVVPRCACCHTPQVDTPESQQRQRAIPDTTQRRLEGFCLNTPLSLSQAQDAEVRTSRSGGSSGTTRASAWRRRLALMLLRPLSRAADADTWQGPRARQAGRRAAAAACGGPPGQHRRRAAPAGQHQQPASQPRHSGTTQVAAAGRR